MTNIYFQSNYVNGVINESDTPLSLAPGVWRKVWRDLRGNQNPYIEGQKTQWSKTQWPKTQWPKTQWSKTQWSKTQWTKTQWPQKTNNDLKTSHRKLTIEQHAPLKTGGELRCSCFISITRPFTLNVYIIFCVVFKCMWTNS